MKLVIPCLRDLDPADARLIRLAEFLGCQSEILRLETCADFCEGTLEQRLPETDCCLVINAALLSRYFPEESFPPGLASFLLKKFPFLLVHDLRPNAFAASTLQALSEGRLRSLQAVTRRGFRYDISRGNEEIYSYFSGLSFDATEPNRDQVFVAGPNSSDLYALITIDGQPFFAAAQLQRATVFFLGGSDIADLEASWNSKSLGAYFSGLLPPAMALRYMFRDECWRPSRASATLVIDDPLLQRNYGFLNYERVLTLMDEHRFHTGIAFIPHNFQRHSPAVTRMFRERPDRYSICFHGNDHTDAEFATDNANLLNSMLELAEARMQATRRITGIECDKIMVFPQGNFSRIAMEVLQARNFLAAVNTVPCPRGEALKLSLADVIQPALLKYGGFPLFLRKYVGHITPEEIAFNLFFGRPVFIVEHHTIFKDPDSLLEVVSHVNRLAPTIRWSSVREAVANSWLRRRTKDGALQIRSYANAVNVENTSDAPLSCSLEWPDRNHSSVETVSFGAVHVELGVGSETVRASFVLCPRESKVLSLVHRNDFGKSEATRQFPWVAKVFVRRRLSEIRDNHLSKHPRLFALAKSFRKLVVSAPAQNPQHSA